MARVPIGSSDSSHREWNYAPEPDDFELRNFSLAADVRVEFLRILKQRLGAGMKLFGSVWSPPGWMKDTGKQRGGGKLRAEFPGVYYLVYAKYLIR